MDPDAMDMDANRPVEGGLAPMFRMPVHFGPAPGPRNVPLHQQRFRYRNRRTALTVMASCTAQAIAAMLSERCTQSGIPRIAVMVSCLTELGWLAGRGYNIVTVQLPDVTFAGRDGAITGTFVPVVWENRADPIITWREELGMAKLFADFPDRLAVGSAHRCSASWDGFRFMELEARDSDDAPANGGRAAPTLLYQYVPSTGAWGDTDIECMTATGTDRNEPPTEIHEHRAGVGNFRFNPASWEDMPTQYPIVNALPAIPLDRFIGATLKTTSQGEVDSFGGGNLCGQRVVA